MSSELKKGRVANRQHKVNPTPAYLNSYMDDIPYTRVVRTKTVHKYTLRKPVKIQDSKEEHLPGFEDHKLGEVLIYSLNTLGYKTMMLDPVELLYRTRGLSLKGYTLLMVIFYIYYDTVTHRGKREKETGHIDFDLNTVNRALQEMENKCLKYNQPCKQYKFSANTLNEAVNELLDEDIIRESKLFDRYEYRFNLFFKGNYSKFRKNAMLEADAHGYEVYEQEYVKDKDNNMVIKNEKRLTKENIENIREATSAFEDAKEF